MAIIKSIKTPRNREGLSNLLNYLDEESKVTVKIPGDVNALLNSVKDEKKTDIKAEIENADESDGSAVSASELPKVLAELINPIAGTSTHHSAINFSCGFENVQSLVEELMDGEAARNYKGGDVKKAKPAHHYALSFSPNDNITPAQAHAFALEFLSIVAPGYQCLLYTHVNRAHLHNHIVIKSVHPETKYRWHDNTATLNNMRSVSDELCRKYGLSVILEAAKSSGVSKTAVEMAEQGKSWKVELAKDLDDVLGGPMTKFEFIDHMNKLGYKVRYTDAHITFLKEGEKKSVRADTLAKQFGEKYSKANIEYSLGITWKRPETQQYEKAKSKTRKRDKPDEAKPKKSYTNEFQRYEKWRFEHQREQFSLRETKLPKGLPYFLRTQRTEVFALRLILLAIAALLGKRITPKRINPEQQNRVFHKAQRRENSGRAKSRSIGNIGYKTLRQSDGKNNTIKLEPLQLLKISAAMPPFYWSARVNRKNGDTTVLVKENNLKLICEIAGIEPPESSTPGAKSNDSARKYNLRMYAEIKAAGAEYLVVNAELLKKLKKLGVKHAVFEMGENRYKFVYQKSDKQKVTDTAYGGEKIEKGITK